MGKTPGAKNISEVDREAMRSIIRPRLKFRDSHEELREALEDKGYDISEATLKGLLSDIRGGLKERFKEIGEYELAQEHDFAIDMMKDLMIRLRKQWSDPDTDKMRLSAEIRAIQRDLIDYYGSTEIVENVFKYFNIEQDEAKEEKVKEVKKKIGTGTARQAPEKKRPKDINKPKKKELMTLL